MNKLLFIALILLAQALNAQSTQNLQQQFDSLYKIPSRLKETIALGQKILSTAPKLTTADSILFGKNALRVGLCMFKTGQHDSVEMLAQTAYTFAAPNSDDHLTALQIIGTLRVLFSDYSTGDSMHEVVLEKRRKYFGPNHLTAIRMLYVMGGSKENQDKYLEAENLFAEGMAIMEEQKMQTVPLYARFSAGLGHVLATNGQYRRAEQLLSSAIANAKNQPNLPPDNLVYSSMIHVLNEQGKYTEALDYIHQTMDLMKQFGMEESQAYLAILYMRARTYQDLGLYRDAIGSFETCMEMGQSLNLEKTPNFFQYIYGSADCLRENGETDKALALLEPWRDSIRIFEWEQTLSKILWLDGMAKCYIKTKHFDKAIEHYEQALTLSDSIFQNQHNSSRNNLLTGLAAAQLANNEPDKAINSLQVSEAAHPDPIKDRYAMGLLARSFSMNKQAELASRAFEDWLAEERQSCTTELFCITEQQRLDRIQKLAFSSNAALSFLEEQSTPSVKFSAQVLDFQLFKKTLLLSAAQKIREHIQADSTLAPTFAAYTDTRERLAWAYTQPKALLENQKLNLPALEARADSLEQAIAYKSTAFASANLRQTFSWIDVRNQLRPGEAAIEIARYYKFQAELSDTVRYALFIIRPEMREKPVAVFLPDGERLDQIMLEKYLVECASPKGKGMTGDLYEAFWKKIEPYLQDVSRLYVSSDGAFLKINLGAIQLPNGQYVADRYELRPVFSLKEIQQKEPSSTEVSSNSNLEKTAFLAGNPTFLLQNESKSDAVTLRAVSGTPDSIQETDPFYGLLRNAEEARGLNLSALPGSEQEVNDIAALLRKKGWQTTVAIGKDAKEDATKSLKNPTVLHLATHGYFLANVRSGTAGLSRSVLENNPMLRSMIFFAGAQNTLDKKPVGKEDGILTAYEAQNLRLEGTELVVLSACQTAQGKIQNGEGVYGLQRALRIAGAESVLLSLWDVDDKVGREFMTAFYGKWLGGMSKAEAFRAAQLEVKKKHPQPFYWAGFVLME